MRIRSTVNMARTALAKPLIATFVALATISLGACGPDNSSSVAASSTSQITPSSREAAAMPSPGISLPAAASSDANATASANSVDSNTSTDSVQSVQASLAADSQQVAPVMSYAPGDSAQQDASNDSGNSSSH